MKLKILIALGVLAAGGAAFAQQPGGGAGGATPDPRQAMRQACAADFKTLCDGKDGREAFMCLRENIEKASPACKDAVSKLPRPAPPPAG